MVTASQVFDLLNREFPFETQDSWDNSGLLVYSGAETESVLLCLDVTPQAVEAAVEIGAKLIVSNHPVIFSPLKEIFKETQSLFWRGLVLHRFIIFHWLGI